MGTPVSWCLLLILVSILASPAFGQINPGSSTTGWVPLIYGNNNTPDPSADQQTGDPEGDIIGNLSHPSLYMRYNNGGFGSTTDGWLAFRFRLGGDPNPPGFRSVALVGLDANVDGSVDLFLGVNNSGNPNHIGIWNAGSGANTSPSSTTINTTPVTSYSETGANYSWMTVSALSDPTAFTFDLNADGRTDRFLTFVVRFSDVTVALANQGIAFDINSPMQLVGATSTQINSLNQDLNGVNGQTTSGQTWDQLGGFTLQYTPSSIGPIPEPSGFALTGVGGLLLCFLKKRRAL